TTGHHLLGDAKGFLENRVVLDVRFALLVEHPGACALEHQHREVRLVGNGGDHGNTSLLLDNLAQLNEAFPGDVVEVADLQTSLLNDIPSDEGSGGAIVKRHTIVLAIDGADVNLELCELGEIHLAIEGNKSLWIGHDVLLDGVVLHQDDVGQIG